MEWRISLGDILGILIVLGIVIGIVVPFIGLSNIETRASGWSLEELLKNIPIPFIHVHKELVKEYNFIVRGNLSIVAYVEGGGLRFIEKGGNEANVKVYEFKFPWIMGISGEKYFNVNYDEDTNTLYMDVKGYEVELYLPTNLVGNITLEVIGGGVEVDEASLTNLKVLNIKARGGALDLNLKNLGNVESYIDVRGGAIDAELRYSEFTGEALSIIIISGGVIDLDVSLPHEVKVKVDGEVSGGIASIEVNGVNVSGSFTEKGYGEAKGKLHLTYRISGGVADIGIHK